MDGTVWGDLLFFVNFCMDFQCLFLTARLLHRPFSLSRAVIFSVVGAVYAVAALFFTVSGVLAFLFDCGVCYLMCVGTFVTKKHGLSRTFLPFLMYFGVSFAVGGVMSGMASLLSHLTVPLAAAPLDVSSGLFFLLAALGGLFTFLWARFCQQRAKSTHATLTVTVGERTYKMEALVDTANFLRDPVGGKPVVIVTKKVARRVFPPALYQLAAAGSTALADLPPQLARRVRLLPTGTALGSGLLLAFSPDAAFLNAGRGEVPVSLLLALSPAVGGFADCDALLPAALIVE